MRISVIGAGHVGLVAGACFAEIGHDVVCADNDPSKLEALNRGQAHFAEPHLQELLTKNLEAKRLRFTGELEDAADHADVIFLCTGTPPLPGGEADLSSVERVARRIAVLAKGYKLLVEKSTVPVQTGERIDKTMRTYQAQRGIEFDVASNPEFLSEGSAVRDFLFPNRIVIGVENERSEKLLREIYDPLIEGKFSWRPPEEQGGAKREIPLVVTNRNTAEIIKHASNSFLATKISFINMVARLCEQVGGDVSQVSLAMGLDERIGSRFLNAGIGFGGFCFPKDLQAFVRMGEHNGCDFNLLREVERVNESQVNLFVQTIKSDLWVLRGKKIAAWGLAFKPQTDDLRFSPALAVIGKLLAEGAEVRAYDPQAMEEARREAPSIEFSGRAEEAVEGADALVILTEWPEFREADFARVRDSMARPLIFDGRNLLDGARMRGMGFEYVSIGRP